MRGGGRGCACDYGEEGFNSVGGGEGEEDERRQQIYQMHSLSEEAYYTYNGQYKELPQGDRPGSSSGGVGTQNLTYTPVELMRHNLLFMHTCMHPWM